MTVPLTAATERRGDQLQLRDGDAAGRSVQTDLPPPGYDHLEPEITVTGHYFDTRRRAAWPSRMARVHARYGSADVDADAGPFPAGNAGPPYRRTVPRMAKTPKGKGAPTERPSLTDAAQPSGRRRDRRRGRAGCGGRPRKCRHWRHERRARRVRPGRCRRRGPRGRRRPRATSARCAADCRRGR